ncbi:9128_t:CDS:2 [Gigaspora margarita]|uniref:9128_t:CDS:1 n=1 Tax=Gigaspora margarita TaxID=4874 RepID=A0ABN7WB85_GIGMA|nr:9128_t:CDS:2 [Gigaspora margarita]
MSFRPANDEEIKKARFFGFRPATKKEMNTGSWDKSLNGIATNKEMKMNDYDTIYYEYLFRSFNTYKTMEDDCNYALKLSNQI